MKSQVHASPSQWSCICVRLEAGASWESRPRRRCLSGTHTEHQQTAIADMPLLQAWHQHSCDKEHRPRAQHKQTPTNVSGATTTHAAAKQGRPT